MSEEQYEIHPDIAKDIPKPVEIEQPEEQVEEQEAPVEQQEEPRQSRVAEAAEAKRQAAERNHALLREKAERLERERDEALKRLQEISYKKPEEIEEELAHPNDLVEGKTVNKLQKEVRALRKVQEESNKKLQESYAEMRIKTQYPDFDDICSKENLEEFRSQYPELAESIISTGDTYKAAVSAYTAIKNMGISHKKTYDEDISRINKNSTKPRASASISPSKGDTPLDQANLYASGLTKELKAKLRKEMDESSKNY